MNHNLLTERALRDVFEISDYINFGTPDRPLEYGLKPAPRSNYGGKQFGTEVLKKGRLPLVLFQKEWPWVSDGDLYIDHTRYVDTQHDRYKGFMDSDFSKKDEFSNTFRTEQYRELLNMEHKHAKRTIEETTANLQRLKEKYELEKPRHTRFDGPQYLFDINRSAVTPHCMRCHKDTYFCPHRAAYGTGNPHLDKERGGLTTASEEVGRSAKNFNYAKPAFAKKPIIRDTFYRRQNVVFPAKTKTNFLNQALIGFEAQKTQQVATKI
ncbi:hypothetical protein L7F22_061404 [Adiantum nelumboides]|nr:hypothetical protein [Adiantum nelumboides]